MRDDRGVTGVLYGVGVGPGDPGLLTLKGRDILLRVSTVFVPAPGADKPSLAMSIVESAGLEDLDFRRLVFPMSRDEKTLADSWDAAAAEVCTVLGSGKDAAFITLGDPYVYSTFSYLADGVRRRLPSAKIETVPGITTMNLAAALLNRPLVEGGERLCLLPLPEDLGEIAVLARSFDTIVLYKIAGRLREAAAAIAGLGLSDSTAFVSRAGLPDQTVVPALDGLPADAAGYLSVLIVKTGRRA